MRIICLVSGCLWAKSGPQHGKSMLSSNLLTLKNQDPYQTIDWQQNKDHSGNSHVKMQSQVMSARCSDYYSHQD